MSNSGTSPNTTLAPSAGAENDFVWNVLVVDDEEDVHAITRLALKNKAWRRRPFRLVHAHSAAQAREILTTGTTNFQVALIDVVMETDDAGLKLSAWIRSFCPNSLRIVLRTGQAGVAPEHYVLNEFDIDYYISKAEVDVDRLYRVISSALRSSQDIATLLSFGAQLRNFTSVLQSVASLDDLLLFMKQGLRFLGLKYQGEIFFFHDLGESLAQTKGETRTRVEVLSKLHATGQEQLRALAHKDHGLGENFAAMLFSVTLEAPDPNSEPAVVQGAVCMEFTPGFMTANAVEGMGRDLGLFLDNWKTAYVALRLQQRSAQERILREQMYFDRLHMIANMVTGIAHEINTPLGVASTANSMITSLTSDLLQTLKEGKPAGELVADLEEATRLMGKNLQRAHTLIKSFKQLSSSQLSDERSMTSVDAVVRDCVETLTPETRKNALKIEIAAPPPDQLEWNGYAGYLGQVVVNIIQNVMRYAYSDGGGRLEIRIAPAVHKGVPSYRLEFQDFGRGIASSILPRIFDPFVTTGRTTGGTGLGLAISRNIMSELLHGSISCRSSEGQGATFIVLVPKEVPMPKHAASVRPPPGGGAF